MKVDSIGEFKSCPELEDLIDYAFFELEKEKVKKLEAHIENCERCLDMVVLIRAGVEKAKKAESKIIRDSLKGEFQKILEKVKGAKKTCVVVLKTKFLDRDKLRKYTDYSQIPIPLVAQDEQCFYIPVNLVEKGQERGLYAKIVDFVQIEGELVVTGYFSAEISPEKVTICLGMWKNKKVTFAKELRYNKENRFFSLKFEDFQEVNSLVGLTIIKNDQEQ